MNVLILSLVFPPDSVSTAEIMGDLAVDLQRHGHAVTVLTTVPHYNPDKEAEGRQPRHAVWGPLLGQSQYQGVTVYHTAMPAKTGSVARRLTGWAGFHAISTIAGVLAVPPPDLILSPSPPLSIGVSAWMIGLLRRAPFVYNVQEIYPDIAVNLGAVKNRAVIAALHALERFVYGRAAMVTVIAGRMRQRLLEKGVPPDKVQVISNFVDVDRLTPASRDNPFGRRWGLGDRFAVTYAGNIGPAQGLDTVAEAARLIPPDSAVKFFLIGDGIFQDRLMRSAAASPRTLAVVPYQPVSLMPEIYGASDVCLVPQAAATGSDAIPSKVYRIMASARPLIAVTDERSDLAALVQAAGCGVVVPPGDARALADAAERASHDRGAWQEMGCRGRDYVVRHHARAIVSAQYDALIRSLNRPGGA